LEDAFWDMLQREAADKGISITALVSEIDRTNKRLNLASAIRLHVLEQALSGRL
jgi:predicted DNA-binding ribbon-helix-helix protein